MNTPKDSSNKRSRWRFTRLTVALVVAGSMALLVSACGSSSDSGGSGGDEIVIGASIPLTGPLASFGVYQKWGYQHAVDEVNKSGGIEVDGTKKKVKLVLLDDTSDPNTVSTNTDRLISKDQVDAMLGSCTPPLVNAGAVVAERNRVPLITPCEPLGAFRAVKDWQYAWAIFFDEAEATEAPFKMLTEDKIPTNKKVAILHDNEPDGINFAKLWEQHAKTYGYDVVLDQQFPDSATTFSSAVTAAKNSGADIVFGQTPTPQAVAIRKEMAAQGYTPKILQLEKGAEPAQFAKAVGSLSKGVLVTAYWNPTFPYPGAASLRKQFESQTGNSFSQHIADTDAAATVLLDSIKRAGSTDKEKINTAIGETDMNTVVGPVKFADDHTATLPSVEGQWQSPDSYQIVWPKDRATGKLIFPLP